MIFFSGSKLAQGWEHCSVVSLVLLGVGLSLLFALSFWLQFGPLGKGLQLQALCTQCVPFRHCGNSKLFSKFTGVPPHYAGYLPTSGQKNPYILVRIRIWVKFFSLTAFWRYIYTSLQRWKVKKKSKTSRNRGFSYYFCLLRTGSGSVQIMTDPDPGGPKTSGSTILLKSFTLRLQIFDL